MPWSAYMARKLTLLMSNKNYSAKRNEGTNSSNVKQQFIETCKISIINVLCAGVKLCVNDFFKNFSNK